MDRFGDIEAALVTRLNARYLSRGDAATAADDDYKPSSHTRRPDRFCVVRRLGGAKANTFTDAASVTFECYDTTNASARQLADITRAEVFALAGDATFSVPVDRVEEVAGPGRLPHPSSSNPRYVFTERLYFRGAAE